MWSTASMAKSKSSRASQNVFEVQGFLFSPARPACEIAALLSGFAERAARAA
jgi:hypothetical protein